MYKRAFAPIALLLMTVPAATEAQSAVPASEPAVAPEPSKLLDRVITNQKRDEAALDVYERLERLETRKNANDPVPSSMKIARVIPSGTGMDKIPVKANGHPSDAEAYRARL